MDQTQAITQALPWVLAILGGPAGVWGAGKGIAALLRWAHDKEVRIGELERTQTALARKIDQYQEMAQGEHGFYTKFAKYDEALLNWARWRHDVMDKEMSRLAGEVGAHDDDIEDLRKELSLCERRK